MKNLFSIVLLILLVVALNDAVEKTITKVNGSTTLNGNFEIWQGSSSSTFTLTLPSSSAIDGRYYIIKNVGSATITVAPAEGDSIEEGELFLTTGQVVELYCDSTNEIWRFSGMFS